jgi:hypothetical protein
MTEIKCTTAMERYVDPKKVGHGRGLENQGAFPELKTIQRNLRALISPHAGY